MEELIMGKKRSNTKQATDRRAFLKGVVASGGAAAVAMASTKGLAAPADAPTTEHATEAPAQGYHETPHIRDYYKTAGF
jgi:hypothetical protein